MPALFREVFFEQTSPAEILILYYVLVSFLAALALLAYGAIVSLIWSVRLQGGGLARVFSPPGHPFKDYLGECLLVGLTAALLTHSLVDKHSFVEQIVQFKISDPNRREVSQLFPLHALPDEVEQRDHELLFLRDEDGVPRHSAELPASTYIKPVLESGRSAAARVLVLDIISRADPEGTRRLPMERALPIAIALAGVAYLGWLAYRRTRASSDRRDPSALGLGRTLSGLLMLAVSTALVLSTPFLLDDHNLADAALAVLERQPPGPQEQERYADAVRNAVLRQQGLYSDLRLLRPSTDASVESVWTLFSDIESQTRALEQAVLKGDSDLAVQLSGFEDRREEDLEQLDDRFGSVRDAMGEVRKLVGNVQDGEELLRKNLATVRREMTLLFDQAEQGGLEVRRHGQDIQELFTRVDRAEETGKTNRAGLADSEATWSRSRQDLDTRLEEIGKRVGGIAAGFLILNAARPADFVIEGAGGRKSIRGPTVLEMAPGTYQVSAVRSRPLSVVVEGGKVVAVWFSPPGELY